jgi:hypothetical protein
MKLVRNLIKYSVGLPILLGLTVFFVLLDIMDLIINGKHDPIVIESFYGVWKPIE